MLQNGPCLWALRSLGPQRIPHTGHPWEHGAPSLRIPGVTERSLGCESGGDRGLVPLLPASTLGTGSVEFLT